MSYAQLDVHFDEHPKYEGLSLAHMGLIACAISYCNRALTDGRLPARRVGAWGLEGEAARLIPELLRRQIWKATPDGYEIVGYLDHNPSAKEVKARVAARRKRQLEYVHQKRRVDVLSTRRQSGDSHAQTVASTVTSTADAAVAKAPLVSATAGFSEENTINSENCLRVDRRVDTVVEDAVVNDLDLRSDAGACNGGETPSEIRMLVAPVAVADPEPELVPDKTKAESMAEREHVYRDAYCRGIAEGKGTPYAWPGNEWAQKDLNHAISVFAVYRNRIERRGQKITGADLLRWIQVTACEFADEVSKKGNAASFYSAYAPKGFVRWFNERSDSRRTG
jgi:hypothetical protein